MNPKQVIEFFGSQVATAVALGVTQPSVAGWVSSGSVPEGKQYQIELATNGMLRADKPALRIQGGS